MQAWPVMVLKYVDENEMAQQEVGTAAERWNFSREKIVGSRWWDCLH